MVITTSRLSIVSTSTDEWVEISIYPRTNRSSTALEESVEIKYDSDSIESDIELETIIGLFNGEPTWRRQYLEGNSLSTENDSELFFSYSIPEMEMKAIPYKRLDFFTISLEEFWNKGLPEIHFIAEDLLAGKNTISIKTAARLEALKYLRLALGNFD